MCFHRNFDKISWKWANIFYSDKNFELAKDYQLTLRSSNFSLIQRNVLTDFALISFDQPTEFRTKANNFFLFDNFRIHSENDEVSF